MVFVCFFKQKTAYELRISDWNSDVCSSDLARGAQGAGGGDAGAGRAGRLGARLPARAFGRPAAARGAGARAGAGSRTAAARRAVLQPRYRNPPAPGRRAARPAQGQRCDGADGRSEEHTSELQSLMGHSYAVFCLQKKKISVRQRRNSSHKKNIVTNKRYIKEALNQ